ncbi:MFS transporter [Kribbella solani]|uniref:Putative MFS family arabinose efflux permease n=1 Tax=Kribbella solani TaxID=236067 RepID=A0A841DTP6_9ACTN|nr:MFS transporter [Kribbella solani]MBB5980100.1 putative MFS family arabinose efflux permease [Kribbella solani]MDX2972927.1 MFS transporter [Kribbella solani]MDX3005533.1 MFS transporter [Kribbella solani]
MTDTRAPEAVEGQGFSWRPLLWLAVATFSMGIDGYVLAGLLPQIAGDLHVSAAAAGQLMSVFALTAAIAGPVFGTLTSRWERRTTIALALAVFVLGNVIVAVATNYPIALSGRVIAALGGSLLNAAVVAYALALTPVAHHGKALSFVLGGWMTATALGVPVGLILGQSSWRFPMILVAIVGTSALIGILLRLPKLHLPGGTLADRIRPLGQPRLVAGLFVSSGILCSSYACFTYATLILGPHFHEHWAMIVIMFGYGVASMAGNAITGRLVDRFSAIRVLTVILTGLLLNAILGMVALMLAPAVVAAVWGLVWFFSAGVGNGGAAVPQQARLASLAPDSAAIVIALNGSAISLGGALGSGLGGVALTAGAAPNGLLGVSAVILALTVLLHLLVSRTKPTTI